MRLEEALAVDTRIMKTDNLYQRGVQAIKFKTGLWKQVGKRKRFGAAKKLRLRICVYSEFPNEYLSFDFGEKRGGRLFSHNGYSHILRSSICKNKVDPSESTKYKIEV